MSYPNEEQTAVLRQLYGTLLVLAPAGTGKTRIMANRLAAVIADGMPPGSTLGVTFTNRAAEQMRIAVRDVCGSDAAECRIQTFHSLCAWMLRMEARDLGLPADFVIYDEQDSIDLLRDCLTGISVSPDAAFWQLSQIKSDCPPDGLTVGEIPSFNLTGLTEPYRKALRIYHEHLAERNALDFPDLLYRTRAMLAIHTVAIKDTLIPPSIAKAQATAVYASEADLLNVALFGQTAKQWRDANPGAEGNLPSLAFR